MDRAERLWIIGQITALGVLVILTIEYSFGVGLAAGYALCVLVDIRKALES